MVDGIFIISWNVQYDILLDIKEVEFFVIEVEVKVVVNLSDLIEFNFDFVGVEVYDNVNGVIDVVLDWIVIEWLEKFFQVWQNYFNLFRLEMSV